MSNSSVNELKRANLKLQKREQELEKLNKELEDFAYIVSHDLKAPLRAISSLASWILEDYKDKFDKEGLDNMQLLISRTKRMNSLIEGILEYSRAGKQKYNVQEVNTKVIIDEVLDSLDIPESFSIEKNNISQTVKYDEVRLYQVFQNLISNAIKYMGKNEGKITISCQDNDTELEFSIADTGIGIEKKHFERIFQIFQTLKARDDMEATGIGLTLVKRIVSQHGGKVWVDSKSGEGSTFYFTIPKN